MASKRQPTLKETWSGRQNPGLGFSDDHPNNSKIASNTNYSRGQGRGMGNWRKNEGNATARGRGQGPSKAKKRGGAGRGRGRGNSIRIPNSVISLEEDDDELCHQALGQFELAESEVAKALEAGAAADKVPGFDETAGETWIYPTNRPVRDYQFRITETALFHNTFVSLPTGLGKTFIAAVVMYNYYRWYPNDIIVFMAPTRPLVTQQLDACHNIVGINPAVTVELTGQILPAKRETLWKEKRAFFLTPQVMQSDINRNFCNAERVRCVVIDEAHKAVGNHSYAQVISSIIKKNNHFRVLALSATPGNDVDAIQEVFKNLLISRVELRSDKSPDILPYVHDREVEIKVVSMDPFLMSVHEKMKDIFQVYTGKLMQQNILPRNGSSLGSYQLLQSRQRFRASPPPQLGQTERGYIEVAFSTCISLARSIELLNIHGLRSFYSFLQGLLLREKGSAVVASELRKKGVDTILSGVQEKLNISIENSSFNISASGLFDSFNESGNPSLPQAVSTNIDDYLQSHPKMKILKGIVEDHFKTFAVRNESTRVMIFSQYRDSVQEIGNLLNLLKPLVKPMIFMGQAKTAGAGGRGLKQKEQIQVVEKFKEGGFNVLVATSVGEEGLDIGEVDLIICFDSNKSPTRNIQRMGRTGRKRQGRIIFLLTEGREERLYRFSVTQQSSIQRSIMDPGKLQPYLYLVSPRMVPAGVEPQCFKMSIILSSEHENYHTNQRKMIGHTADEITLDDSDFIRPSNPTVKKKKQKGLSGKVKLGKKKSDGSTKSITPEVNTIARCIELMESRKATQSKSVIPTETIVIDDEHPCYTPPITDFDHSVAMVDDDYDILCTLFDIREVNAQSTASPCVHVPLQSQEFVWKMEYNNIFHEDILISDLELQTVKELVDSSVYAGSIDRFCKCGNPGSADISLAGSLQFENAFEEELDHSCGNDYQTLQGFTKSPNRKSLTEMQPTAFTMIRKSLYPSPSPGNKFVKSSLPIANVSTPLREREDGFVDQSKYFRKNPDTKSSFIEEFDAGFIFNDENDPMFNDSWMGEIETTTGNTSSSALCDVNNQIVNTPDVNTLDVNIPINKPSVYPGKSYNYSEALNVADDSSTASESDFVGCFNRGGNVSQEMPEGRQTYSAQQPGYNSKDDRLYDLQEPRTNVSIDSDRTIISNMCHSEPSEIASKIPKLIQTPVSAKPSSPDLGLRRRKFIFKKKTSLTSFSLSPVGGDASANIQTKDILPRSCSTGNILPVAQVQKISDASSCIIPEKSPILGTLKKYNPREIFSRVVDDSEIDFIPGTSSDEEEVPKCVAKCALDNVNQDFGSDSTTWDPDELPATPPESYNKRLRDDLSSTEKQKPCSSKRDTDFVFSPDRRNFPLASQSKNRFNGIFTSGVKPVKIRSDFSAKMKSTKSYLLASCKGQQGASQLSFTRSPALKDSSVLSHTNTEIELSTKPSAPEVDYRYTTPKPLNNLDRSNSINYFETPKSKQATPPAKKFKFTSKPNRTVNIADSPYISKSPSPMPQPYLSTSTSNQVDSPHVFSTPARTSTFGNPRANFSSPILSSCVETSSPDSGDMVFRKRGAARRIIDSDESPAVTKPTARKLPKKKPSRNPFICDEAAGTSDDSSVEEVYESNYVNNSFVLQGDDEDDDLITPTQQQVMYLQSVKDVLPVRAGRIEEPLLPLEGPQYEDDMQQYLYDSFCEDEVEYADVGVYTQCMIAAREEIEKEKSSGKPKRRLRSRR